MKTLDCYFDFVSPFSYFAVEQIDRFPRGVEIRLMPVLFAGLLNHWKHKGPAELAPKRRFTMRYVQWLATRHHIPLRIPPAHPFNPLAVLRLSIALNNEPDVVRQIFRFIWQQGRRPDEPDNWAELKEHLNVPDADTRISSPDVKDRLRRNGDEALERGIFGVPSFVVDGEIFWGFDAVGFVIDYLRNPTLFQSAEMQRVSNLPIGVERQDKQT
ncbi:MAG: 2-hydroxychromene-2-carboxylate isomerase [Acidiferrobacterales bacterium]